MTQPTRRTLPRTILPEVPEHPIRVGARDFGEWKQRFNQKNGSV